MSVVKYDGDLCDICGKNKSCNDTVIKEFLVKTCDKKHCNSIINYIMDRDMEAEQYIYLIFCCNPNCREYMGFSNDGSTEFKCGYCGGTPPEAGVLFKPTEGLFQ